MGGPTLTATGLAYCANASRSTARSHLSNMVAAGSEVRISDSRQ